MARRRRSSAANDFSGTFALGLLGVAVTLGILGWLFTHPTVAIPLGLIGATGTGLGIRARLRRREQERIAAAERAQIRAARSMEIQRYHHMTARQFEEAIAYLCERDGCTGVQVVGGAGDLGADVIAMTPDGRKLVIQCKRYGPTTKVGSPDMQKFGGTCYAIHNAGVAVLVTTNLFTRQAADYGTRQRIRLYDRDMLAGWASRTGPAPWH